MLAVVGEEIVRFDADLRRVSASRIVDPAGELSAADLDSVYTIDGTWYLILKSIRWDVGDAMTHIGTLVTADLPTGEVRTVLPIRLDHTDEMGTLTVVPASWFTELRP